MVSGAASGLGAALCVLLRSAGWHVAGVDLKPSEADLSLTADVTDPEAIATAVASAVDAFGALDGVAGCAGSTPREFHLAHVTTDSDWSSMIAVNLTGQFLLARSVLPHLVRSHGSLCLVASVSAAHPLPGAVAYCAAKAGVVALARSLALEYAPTGVSVNVVSPGYMDTPMAAPTLARPEMRDRIASAIPVGDVASPAAVAEVILFLLTGNARHLAGEEITVDGAQGLTSYGGVPMVKKLWEHENEGEEQ
jgi:NAD(P)-dependent dehydrogenase (short-subunit alcohol dehydrogenase family)